MKIYKSCMNAIAFLEKTLMSLLLLIEVTLTAGNVLSRYVTHSGWSFTEEVVVALLVLMSLLGAALCAREKGGLSSLSLFTDRMPRKVRLVVDVLVILLSILFAGIMLWFGIQRCLTQIRSNRTTSILQLPEWYYSSFVPIGGALLILHFIEKMVDDIQECISCTDGGEGPAR